MGTNYYWHEKSPCPTCGRAFEEKHIGKSSGGWCFALHVYPEEGPKDLDEWKVLWVKEGSWIENEYNQKISTKEMDLIIRMRSWPGRSRVSKDEWYLENYAESGPNGLARSKVDGHHCIGHGSGTWDLMIGEFS